MSLIFKNINKILKNTSTNHYSSTNRNNILVINIPKKTFLFAKSKPLEKVLLNESNKEGVKITFYSKAQVSKESYVLRFLLPDSDSVAGFNTCQYVNLQALESNSEKRPYHPISLDTDKGFIDFLIKVYSNPDRTQAKSDNYGLFSNYLINLQVN